MSERMCWTLTCEVPYGMETKSEMQLQPSAGAWTRISQSAKRNELPATPFYSELNLPSTIRRFTNARKSRR